MSSPGFPWLQSQGECQANCQLRGRREGGGREGGREGGGREGGREGGRGEESSFNTVEPQNNGTLGPGILSFRERLSTLRRLKMY